MVAGGVGLVRDGGEEVDVGEVGTESREETTLGSGVGVGGDEDDAALDRRRAIGQERAAGDGGGDAKGEDGFAAGVIAVEQCDAREGQAFLPEPADGLWCGVGGVVLIGGGGMG
jgi:hypothetical protein